MKYIINECFEAENISTACVNPCDVTFDLWNIAANDFTGNDINTVHALEERLIDIPDAVGIMQAAGMNWVVCRDCTDPRGYMTEAEADRDIESDSRFEPIKLNIEEYLRSILGI